MIAVPAGVKVHLALGHTDMRNYAERAVMLSLRRGAAAGRGHLVGLTRHNLRCAPTCSAWRRACGAESAGLQHRWRDRSERFELLGRIGAQVDLRALKAGMAEPERDLANVSCRLQRMHGAGVAKDVRRDALFGDRRRCNCAPWQRAWPG